MVTFILMAAVHGQATGLIPLSAAGNRSVEVMGKARLLAGAQGEALDKFGMQETGNDHTPILTSQGVEDLEFPRPGQSPPDKVKAYVGVIGADYALAKSSASASSSGVAGQLVQSYFLSSFADSSAKAYLVNPYTQYITESGITIPLINVAEASSGDIAASSSSWHANQGGSGIELRGLAPPGQSLIITHDVTVSGSATRGVSPFDGWVARGAASFAGMGVKSCLIGTQRFWDGTSNDFVNIRYYNSAGTLVIVNPGEVLDSDGVFDFTGTIGGYGRLGMDQTIRSSSTVDADSYAKIQAEIGGNTGESQFYCEGTTNLALVNAPPRGGEPTGGAGGGSGNGL